VAELGEEEGDVLVELESERDDGRRTPGKNDGLIMRLCAITRPEASARLASTTYDTTEY